jgi:uncharacterized protein
MLLKGGATILRWMDLPIDRAALEAVLRRHGVRFALVFGSQAEGTARAGSDVDVAVWAEAPVDEWRLRGELPDEVDLVDLRRAPAGLVGRIAVTGQVILDDDPVRRIRWQAAARKRHLDEAFRRDRFRRDFAQAQLRAHG